jgi:hypothetical protein
MKFFVRPHRPQTRRVHAWALLSAITLIAAVPALAQNASTDYEHLGRGVLKELIETNTTHSTGSVTAAAELMAARLVAAGFPKADVEVVSWEPARPTASSSATPAFLCTA